MSKPKRLRRYTPYEEAKQLITAYGLKCHQNIAIHSTDADELLEKLEVIFAREFGDE